MKNEFSDFWSELFLWLITFLVFTIFTALTFFRLTGEWSFLQDFSYWFDLASSTTVAWALRFMWANKGLSNTLWKNEEVKQKEKGKDNVIAEITKNNLTDILEDEIDLTNKKEKLKQYKIKCEKKIKKFTNRRYFKRKDRVKYWREERTSCDKDDFNVDTVRVKYYKYDIDSMLSSTYRPNGEVETRGSLTTELLKSYRIAILTTLAFAILGAIQLWLKDYTNEDLVMLGGKFIVFLLNMKSGYSLGRNFVTGSYSRDLTKDYVFMKKVLKQHTT